MFELRTADHEPCECASRKTEFGMSNTAALRVSQVKLNRCWSFVISTPFHLNSVSVPPPGNQRCAPKVSSMNITVDGCSTVIRVPVCRGQCASQPRWEEIHLFNHIYSPFTGFPSFILPSVLITPTGRWYEVSCMWSRTAGAARNGVQRRDLWICSASVSLPDDTSTSMWPAVNVEPVAAAKKGQKAWKIMYPLHFQI